MAPEQARPVQSQGRPGPPTYTRSGLLVPRGGHRRAAPRGRDLPRRPPRGPLSRCPVVPVRRGPTRGARDARPPSSTGCLSVDPAERYADGEASPRRARRRVLAAATRAPGARGGSPPRASRPSARGVDRRARPVERSPGARGGRPASRDAVRAGGHRPARRGDPQAHVRRGVRRVPLVLPPDGATPRVRRQLRPRVARLLRCPPPEERPRALTHEEGVWDLAPAYSPDGTRIAFLRLGDGKGATYVIGADGKGERRILEGGSLRPAWSPDGKSIWCGGPPVRAPSRRRDGRPPRDSQGIDEGTTLLNARSKWATRSWRSCPRTTYPGQTRRLRDRRARPRVPPALAPRRRLRGGPRPRAGRRARPGLPGALERRHRAPRPPPRGGPSSLARGLGGRARAKASRSRPAAPAPVWSTCQVRDDIVRANARGALEPLHARGEWDEMTIAGMPGSTDLLALSMRTGLVTPWIVDPRRPRARARGPLRGPPSRTPSPSPPTEPASCSGTREGLRARSRSTGAPRCAP